MLGTARRIQFRALFGAHSQGILEALGAWVIMQLLQSGAPKLAGQVGETELLRVWAG